MLNSNVTYFDSFEEEHILQEIKVFIGNKNIKTEDKNTSVLSDNVWIFLYWFY